MDDPRRRALAQRASLASFHNDPREASAMRGFVSHFLSRSGVPDEVADEVLVAVGEVVANACRHGRDRNDPGEVEVNCRIEPSHITIEITDCGPGFDVASVLHSDVPDLLSSGGRGFFLMRQLMDDVAVDSSGEGTTVLLRRKIPR